MSESPSVEQPSVEQEGRYHHYTGNEIPWYVRFLWIMFWVFAVYYVITYFFPTLQIELITPP